MVNQLVIYSDEGVGPLSLKQLVSSLRALPCTKNYQLLRKDHRFFTEENWEERCALLIFPGGRDVFYQKWLRGDANARIKQYVERGGRFLGICAGGYYAARSISFEEGGELEIVEERELAFFPGVARGPLYGKGLFRYGSECGARVAELSLTKEGGGAANERAVSYFNGGCEFVDAANFENVAVVARYSDVVGEPAAIVDCKVGDGRALLCGVHPEFNPENFDRNDPYLYPLRKRLRSQDALRRHLLERLFSRLLQ